MTERTRLPRWASVLLCSLNPESGAPGLNAYLVPLIDLECLIRFTF